MYFQTHIHGSERTLFDILNNTTFCTFCGSCFANTITDGISSLNHLNCCDIEHENGIIGILIYWSITHCITQLTLTFWPTQIISVRTIVYTIGTSILMCLKLNILFNSKILLIYMYVYAWFKSNLVGTETNVPSNITPHSWGLPYKQIKIIVSNTRTCHHL